MKAFVFSVCAAFFQFTTSQGGRHDVYSVLNPALAFQFTTSQGGRHGGHNSIVPGAGLSIHDLTRRSTELPIFKNNDQRLSIHDLTRRSTQPAKDDKQLGEPFNSRPHKEVDQSGDIRNMAQSTFQFTTSQGGRLVRSLRLRQDTALSIHDLTRRSTRYHRLPHLVLIFQFTTSQGGRPKGVKPTGIAWIFQFTTSQGGRLFVVCVLFVYVIFQFTTSQGGRLGSYFFLSFFIRSFNSRPHKEVDSKYPQISRIFV